MSERSETGRTPDSPEREQVSVLQRIWRFLIGPPRDLGDRRVFHHLSVIAFLAWVGLGADGLSSSAYGPEEAFRTLGPHTYLAIPIAVLMIATVCIISACYSRIIERFPNGGGAYVVATTLLGERAGVLCGAALLVDYVLTITISIAAASDALFSLLPPAWLNFKLLTSAILIMALTTLNIRGVKESIIALLPVFILFLITHAVLIGGGILTHAHVFPDVVVEVRSGFSAGLTTLGAGGMFLLFLQAYSLGGGTYTGIEAVSNGMPIMREPRVATARRTMAYMAISLSITAAGLVVCYLLWSVKPVAGRTLNAVLAESIARDLSLTHAFVVVTLVAEGALLVVAAQTGFIAGPRALANMAIDSWMPRRFSALSERLTTQNGIVLMGAAALAALMYTHGNVREIVIMYSINVFLTFSMSMLGMSRWLLRQRRKGQEWRGQFTLFAFGFIFCMTILGITVFEKFTEGGWMTLVVTGLIVLMCFFVRRHYRATSARLASLFTNLSGIPRTGHGPVKAIDPTQAAAAILVGGYSGLGIHTTLSAFKTFPGQFKSAVFLSVGVIDSRAFKTDDAPDRLRAQTEANLKRYVELMQAQGVPATFRMGIGTDVVSELEELCLAVARDFPRVTFFAGQLIFRNESWFQRILHNETAFALQKRLQLGGHTMVILPVRVE